MLGHWNVHSFAFGCFFPLALFGFAIAFFNNGNQNLYILATRIDGSLMRQRSQGQPFKSLSFFFSLLFRTAMALSHSTFLFHQNSNSAFFIQEMLKKKRTHTHTFDIYRCIFIRFNWDDSEKRKRPMERRKGTAFTLSYS